MWHLKISFCLKFGAFFNFAAFSTLLTKSVENLRHFDKRGKYDICAVLLFMAKFATEKPTKTGLTRTFKKTSVLGKKYEKLRSLDSL